jgi:sortase (surface protein transpeptidase)
VIPSEGSGRVLAQTPRPTLVLTTCHPKYSSSERLIVTARRIEVAT